MQITQRIHEGDGEGKVVNLGWSPSSYSLRCGRQRYNQRDVGSSLFVISGYFQTEEDVPGRKDEMHQDVEGGRHRSLPHQDSGGMRSACSCWGNTFTIRASMVGTKQCLRGLENIRPKYIGQRHAT